MRFRPPSSEPYWRSSGPTGNGGPRLQVDRSAVGAQPATAIDQNAADLCLRAAPPPDASLRRRNGIHPPDGGGNDTRPREPTRRSRPNGSGRWRSRRTRLVREGRTIRVGYTPEVATLIYAPTEMQSWHW